MAGSLQHTNSAKQDIHEEDECVKHRSNPAGEVVVEIGQTKASNDHDGIQSVKIDQKQTGTQEERSRLPRDFSGGISPFSQAGKSETQQVCQRKHDQGGIISLSVSNIVLESVTKKRRIHSGCAQEGRGSGREMIATKRLYNVPGDRDVRIRKDWERSHCWSEKREILNNERKKIRLKRQR
jgi:hypothetical protein